MPARAGLRGTVTVIVSIRFEIEPERSFGEARHLYDAVSST